MRKFSDDLAEDRDFEIGGELFKWRYPYWEELTTIFQDDLNAIAESAKENGDRSDDILDLKANAQDVQKRIAIFLDPDNDAQKRWKALVARKTNPVPYFQYGELYRWLLEVTGARPTQPSSGSEPGDGRTEASSQDASPSPAVTHLR